MELTSLKEAKIEDGNKVNDFGRIDEYDRGGVETGVLFVLADAVELEREALNVFPKLKPPVSTMFREAIMVSINHSWNRSTTSAQVSWNRFSFSNFLKTVPLISTN
jgi:hypothetical protein